MNGINMKAFIVTDIILFDMNDKTLEPGKYYFLIKNFFFFRVSTTIS